MLYFVPEIRRKSSLDTDLTVFLGSFYPFLRRNLLRRAIIMDSTVGRRVGIIAS
jgi:hypothetical protein